MTSQSPYIPLDWLFRTPNASIFRVCRAAVVALFEKCIENPEAVITAIEGREVSRSRPVPLSAWASSLVPFYCCFALLIDN